MQTLEKSILQAILGDACTATGNVLWSRSTSGDDPIPNSHQSTSLRRPLQESAIPLSSYNELSHIDYELNDLVKEVAEAIDGLSSPIGDPAKVLKKLEQGVKQVTQHLPRIRAILGDTNEAVSLQQAMVKRYEDIINGMVQAAETIRARKTPQCPPCTYNNRMCTVLVESDMSRTYKFFRALLRVPAGPKASHHPVCSIHHHRAERLRIPCARMG